MFISIPPRTQAQVMTASVASSHRLNAPLHPSPPPYHSISRAAPRLSPLLKFKSYLSQRGKFISQHLNTVCTSGTLTSWTPSSTSSLGVHCPITLTRCTFCKWEFALNWSAWLNKGQFKAPHHHHPPPLVLQPTLPSSDSCLYFRAACQANSRWVTFQRGISLIAC